MKVYQIMLKVYLMQDIKYDAVQGELSYFIDSALAKDEKFLKKHQENKYKFYCFDLLYPLEKDKIYKKDNIYSFNIRTVDAELVKFFEKNLFNHYSKSLKALTDEKKIISKKCIEKVYSITPCLIKNESYWKDKMTLDFFEKRLKENLIKKYNAFTGNKIDENFQLYNRIEFKNKKPVGIHYKNKTFLGDKVELYVESNETAQELAYFALGCGILENCSRGCGYVNYRWI